MNKVMSAGAARNEAEELRRLAEETREVLDHHREALERIRQERHIKSSGDRAVHKRTCAQGDTHSPHEYVADYGVPTAADEPTHPRSGR